MLVDLYRRSRIQLFWIAMLIAYGLAIMPRGEAPSLGEGDKFDHIAAFLTLTVLGRSAYWMRPPALIGIGLSAFGAFIELSQAVPIINRNCSLSDWVADSIAVLVGLGLSSLLARTLPLFFTA
jgi:hypothetical protein